MIETVKYCLITFFLSGESWPHSLRRSSNHMFLQKVPGSLPLDFIQLSIQNLVLSLTQGKPERHLMHETIDSPSNWWTKLMTLSSQKEKNKLITLSPHVLEELFILARINQTEWQYHVDTSPIHRVELNKNNRDPLALTPTTKNSYVLADHNCAE